MGRRTIAIVIFVFGFLVLLAIGFLVLTQQGTPAETPTPEGTPEATTEPGAAAEEGAPPPGLPGPQETLPPMVEVVVSLQTVPRGWQFTEAELTTDLRLRDEVDSNVVTRVEDVVGKYARTDIFQGETITKDQLASDPTLVGVNDFGPSSLIPPGFVAQAVPMDRLSGVAYGLDEGDYIDILITFIFWKLDPEFQTFLQNSANFFLESVDDEGNIQLIVYTIDVFGRFEELPTGDLAHISPSELQRPVAISMVIQNAKVIQVGAWQPVPPVAVATPTPEPVEVAEGEPTATPGFIAQAPPTPTPTPPDVLLVALSPQQQLLLKYALEANADIDFALRGVNDGQLYSVENVDLNYLLDRFNIEVPADFGFTVDNIIVTVTPPPPTPEGEVQPTPEGG
ncbi:MAG: hypothetical protein D6706_05005 [Chloroflexi bacterium]|nr:MAG: hypothetical protein D6706_05005 [Chloroflexota bacterium]